MTRRAAGARLFEASLFAVASVLLYNLGPLVLLFLVPIQVSVSRRSGVGLLAAPAAFVIFIIVQLVRLAGGPWSAPGALAAVLEIAVVGLLLTGLTITNLPFGGRTLVRLLAGSAAASAGIAGVFAAVAPSQAFADLAQGIFGEIAARLRDVLTVGGADSVASSLLAPLLEPRALEALVREYLLRSFVLDVFALLAFSWWAGHAAAARQPLGAAAVLPADRESAPPVAPPLPAALPRGPARWRFADFGLQAWWLWPLIAALALVGAELALAGLAGGTRGFELPHVFRYVSYAAWNAALIMLFLFGLQALAIARFWIEERGLPRLLWLVLMAGLAVALVSPQVNLVVALVVPLFGASENWVRYRVRRAAGEP